MNASWRRSIPVLAAGIVAAFIVILTFLYADALTEEGIAIEPLPTWGGGAVAASLFAGATYLLTSMPERDRRKAEAVADGLREQELHLQSLLSSAPIMMFRTDKHGVIQHMEGAASDEPPEGHDSWEGVNILDFAREDDDWPDYLRRAIAGEDISALIKSSGKDWEIRYQPWMVDGKSEGMLGIATDVTERREREDQVRKEAAQQEEMRKLREMNDLKTQLLNTAAHELNTPMTPVRLQLHLLKSGLGELNERQQRAVGVLDRSVDRLGLLIDDILDVARLQSGKLKVEPEPTSVREMLQDVVETFQEAATQVGVKLELEPGDDITVMADNRRITQVLTNFASNALKFTPEGGTVSVGCRMRKGRAEVWFKDTGRGLDAEQISRLFQPFSQVHDTKSVTARGSGLGLYICKGILDNHAGTIGVTSEGHGKGSRFHFTLPTTDEQPDVPQEEPTPIPAPQPIAGTAPTALSKRLRELI